MAQKALFFR